MMGQGSLFKFWTSLGSYKNLFNNRLAAAPCFLQNATLKTETKEYLKKLNIPEHPKRPLTPYFRFLQEKREQIRKKNPDLKLTEITQKCAEDWKNANQAMKEKYQEAYSKELLVYNEKADIYNKSLTPEQTDALAAARKEEKEIKSKRILKKDQRDLAKPKRPTGSYILFVKEKWTLPENKDKKLIEMMSKVKDEWKGLSDSEKQKYTQIQVNDTKRYEEEMKKWEAKMIAEGRSDLIRKSSQYLSSNKPSHIRAPKKKVE